MSRAVRPFSDDDLAELLESARRWNDEHGVTGLLLYDCEDALGLSQFCQYVEGPPAFIEQVKARIETDTRHAGIMYLHEGRNVHRLFSNWSMGFEHVSVLPESSGVRQHITFATANPEQLPRNVPAALLRTFVALSSSKAR